VAVAGLLARPQVTRLGQCPGTLSNAPPAGSGLEGDRHFHADGAASGQALTLVAAEVVEVVEDVGLLPGATRRQVTVRDVDVNSLVGKRFRVGEVECLGVELCEPCRHLEEMRRPGIIRELTHRAGINADILLGGVIRVGDPVSSSRHQGRSTGPAFPNARPALRSWDGHGGHAGERPAQRALV
jgi:MOSC domain-containing protein YiiM